MCIFLPIPERSTAYMITVATISRSFARIIVAASIFFFLWTAVEHTAPSYFYNVGSKDVLQYRSAATLFLKGLNPYNKMLGSSGNRVGKMPSYLYLWKTTS